jgi:hypothetical protein
MMFLLSTTGCMTLQVSIHNDASHYVYILIRTISFFSQLTVRDGIFIINARILTNRECCSNCAVWDEYSNWSVNAGSMKSVDVDIFWQCLESL